MQRVLLDAAHLALLLSLKCCFAALGDTAIVTRFLVLDYLPILVDGK